MSYIDDLVNILSNNGLSIDGLPILDGDIHRVISSSTKQSGKKNGWYVGWDKIINGKQYITCVYGDWALSGDPLGTYKSWKDSETSNRDLDEIKRYQEQVKSKQEAETALKHQSAANEAATLWKMLKDFGNSAYLARKCVTGYDIKYDSGYIAIQIKDHDGRLWGLQQIYDDGSKRFTYGLKKKGNFGLIDAIGNTVCFAEGYATAASIYEATGYPVVICFDAGNIKPVVESWRAKYPQQQFIICADNDQWNARGNVGIDKATEAAMLYGCHVAIPVFDGLDVSGKPTDFNDLHLLAGLERVKLIINQSHQPSFKGITMEQAPDYNVKTDIRPQYRNESLPIKHLDTIVDIISARCNFNNRKAFEHAALNVISHIVSGNFISETGDKCSLMVGNVGSVGQLSAINDGIEQLFEIINLGQDIDSDKLSHAQINDYYVGDNATCKLNTISSTLGTDIRAAKRQTSGAIAASLDLMSQIHTKPMFKFRNSKGKRVTIHNPILNSYANFSDSDLFLASKASNLDDTLFSLFLLHVNQNSDFKAKTARPYDVEKPQHKQFIEHINQLLEFNVQSTFKITARKAEPQIISWDIDPSVYDDKINSVSGNQDITSRLRRQFVNVATIVCAWGGNLRVEKWVADICAEYVCYNGYQALQALELRSSDDIAPDIEARVIAKIHDSGNDGITLTCLKNCCSSFRKLGIKEQEDLLYKLEKIDSLIRIAENETGKGKGRPGGKRIYII